MSVRWYGDKFRKEIETKCLQNMETACLFLEGQIKKDISQGQPPSKPGEPPHVLWGTLRRSITHEVEKSREGVIGRVGSNEEYALFLEVGTSKMAARPFLRPGLAKNRRQIAQILMGEK